MIGISLIGISRIKFWHEKPIRFGIVFLLVTILIGQSVSATERSNQLGLFIKPKSCILEKNEHSCEQILQIEWRIKASQPVCLFIKNRHSPLKCWDNITEDENEYLIETGKKLVFELVSQIDDSVIYSTHYKLYKKIATYRKKRRNPWSFY